MKMILRPDRRMLRQFAWAALLVLPLAALLVRWKWELPWSVFWAIAGFGALVAFVELVLVDLLAVPVLEAVFVRPVFQGLTLLAFPIGFVLSHVLIAAIYYLVITPIGLVFRLIGRDALGRRIDRALPSYWHDRGAGRPASSYFKLY
jgi:hypothetical protein